MQRVRRLLNTQPRARLLMLVVDDAGLALAEALAGAEIPVEAVLAPEVAPPTAAIPWVRMPIDPATHDFVLALSDAVISLPELPETTLLTRARELEKQIVTLEGMLPVLQRFTSMTDGLDPDHHRGRARGHCVFGRLEQALLELLAFNWLGWASGGVAESCKRLRRALGWKWRPAAYHGPKAWLHGMPDLAARDPSAPLSRRFAALDRSALHGSYIHRDLIWVTHFMAAAAVFAAVAHEIDLGTWLRGTPWAVAELVMLALILGFLFTARGKRLQDRWTACRLGAEQLRILRLCLPLLLVPRILRSVDRPPLPDVSGRARDFTGHALAEVKRAVRDHGLPQLVPDFSPERAAAWLALMIEDQAGYHRSNCCKLELAQHRMTALSSLFFFLALAAVVAEIALPTFSDGAKYLLLVTAAGPAFAAALHGAETRLGMVHRAALSRDAEADLTEIHDALQRLAQAPPATEAAWTQVRALALRAADAMGQENTSWHSLVRRQRDDMPA